MLVLCCLVDNRTERKTQMRKAWIMIAACMAFCAMAIPVGIADASSEEKPFRRIPIPEREHGYSGFGSVMIRSQAELDRFLRKIRGQDGWNNRAGFEASIEKAELDFAKEVLVILRHTESSGSVRVTFEEPVVRDGTLSWKITSEVPEIGTHDMAYYGFALAVSRDAVEKVDLDRRGTTVRISDNDKESDQ